MSESGVLVKRTRFGDFSRKIKRLLKREQFQTLTLVGLYHNPNANIPQPMNTTHDCLGSHQILGVYTHQNSKGPSPLYLYPPQNKGRYGPKVGPVAIIGKGTRCCHGLEPPRLEDSITYTPDQVLVIEAMDPAEFDCGDPLYCSHCAEQWGRLAGKGKPRTEGVLPMDDQSSCEEKRSEGSLFCAEHALCDPITMMFEDIRK